MPLQSWNNRSENLAVEPRMERPDFRVVGIRRSESLSIPELSLLDSEYMAPACRCTTISFTRGHDVVYPKDTAMAIGFGSRVTGTAKGNTGNVEP